MASIGKVRILRHCPVLVREISLVLFSTGERAQTQKMENIDKLHYATIAVSAHGHVVSGEHIKYLQAT